jgi:K+ transporter
LILDTPAPRSESRLRTGSGKAIAALGVVYGDIGTSPLYAAASRSSISVI